MTYNDYLKLIEKIDKIILLLERISSNEKKS